MADGGASSQAQQFMQGYPGDTEAQPWDTAQQNYYQTAYPYDYTQQQYPAAAVYDYAAYYSAYYGKSQEDYYKERQEMGGSQEPSRSVWLGNIHPDTTEAELQAAFAQFGMIEHVKVLPNKNCAFVRFVELDAAIQAHSAMYGATIHGQQIKIGWGKAEPGQKEDSGPPPCRNLWLGNVSPDITEDQIREIFGKFGHIEKVRILPQKNCAFINFMKLDAAIQAKEQMQGVYIGDRSLKINFGKELSKEEREKEAMERPKPKIDEPPPPHADPPTDLTQKVVIDKLADFVARNGLNFEYQLVEKQKDNPKFAFINEGHPHNAYYRLKIWCLRYPHFDPNEIRKQFEEEQQAQQGYNAVPPPATLQLQQPMQQSYNNVPPPSYESQPGNMSMPPNGSQEGLDYLASLLDNLVPTKDSIKVTKSWIMQRPNMATEIANYILRRVERTRDFSQKLNIIYLIHDILHHSARERHSGETSDDFSNAFKPFLGAILRYSFINEDQINQEKIIKVIRIWIDKGIYDPETVKGFEQEMGVDSSKMYYSSAKEKGDRERSDRDRSDRDRGDRDRSDRDDRRSHHRSSRHSDRERERDRDRSDRKRERESSDDRHDRKRTHS